MPAWPGGCLHPLVFSCKSRYPPSCGLWDPRDSVTAHLSRVYLLPLHSFLRVSGRLKSPPGPCATSPTVLGLCTADLLPEMLCIYSLYPACFLKESLPWALNDSPPCRVLQACPPARDPPIICIISPVICKLCEGSCCVLSCPSAIVSPAATENQKVFGLSEWLLVSYGTARFPWRQF